MNFKRGGNRKVESAAAQQRLKEEMAKAEADCTREEEEKKRIIKIAEK